MIFLEILCSVESSLSQLAALICDLFPVRLTHHKTNRTLSLCILFLFQISPSNLNKQGVALRAWNERISLNSNILQHVFMRSLFYLLLLCHIIKQFQSAVYLNVPVSFRVQTCAWRSHQAAGGSPLSLTGGHLHVSSSHRSSDHPICLHKRKIIVQAFCAIKNKK